MGAARDQKQGLKIFFTRNERKAPSS